MEECDRTEWVAGGYLGVPSVLPCDEPDERGADVAGVALLLAELQDAPHGLGGELDLQAVFVRLDGLVDVVQAFGQLAENLPLLGALLVQQLLLSVLCHFGAPDGVDAQVFVEDHEEVVEPAFAETLVLELCVVGLRGAVAVVLVGVFAACFYDFDRDCVAGLL